MKCLIFAKRNLQEIIRDPLSLIFCLAFPLGLLLIFQVIIAGIGQEGLAATPQFKIEQLATSICIFSFSFVTLFTSSLVAKDRSSWLFTRLRVTPLRAIDFLMGYTLPLLPLVCVQMIICFGTCLFFGLPFGMHLLWAGLSLLPIAILFIGLGLFIGFLCSEKVATGVSSIIVNVVAILGGMFFPLKLMSGLLVDIAYSLPFANAIDVTTYIILGTEMPIIKPLLIVLGYTVVVFMLAIFVFRKKLTSDEI